MGESIFWEKICLQSKPYQQLFLRCKLIRNSQVTGTGIVNVVAAVVVAAAAAAVTAAAAAAAAVVVVVVVVVVIVVVVVKVEAVGKITILSSTTLKWTQGHFANHVLRASLFWFHSMFNYKMKHILRVNILQSNAQKARVSTDRYGF